MAMPLSRASSADISFKVAILGDSGVGKTDLLHIELGDDSYKPGSKQNFAVSAHRRNYVVQKRSLDVRLLDIPGQQRFLRLASRWCSGVAAVVLVYDTSRRLSFDHLKTWLEEATGQRANESVVKLLIGNSLDASAPVEVGADEASDFAKRNGMIFYQTSIATGEGIHEAFTALASAVLTMIPTPLDPTLLIDSQIKLEPHLLKSPSFQRDLYPQLKVPK